MDLKPLFVHNCALKGLFWHSFFCRWHFDYKLAVVVFKLKVEQGENQPKVAVVNRTFRGIFYYGVGKFSRSTERRNVIMTFGEKLNYLRKKAVLTQDEVAKQLGISPQAVSKWENDLSCPDIMLLPEIARLYGITVDALLAQGIPDFSQVGGGAEKTQEKPTELAAEEKENTKQQKVIAEKEKESDAARKGADSRSGITYLKVKVISQNGDNVNVKLPVSLLGSFKGLMKNLNIAGNGVRGSIDLSAFDIDEIISIVESGAMGDIAHIVTQNGDIIDVFVEKE